MWAPFWETRSETATIHELESQLLKGGDIGDHVKES